MKIGFTGTMSVGKTTLVKALQQLPEFKDYQFSTERSKYLRDLGIPLNTDSTVIGQTVFLAERSSELLRENMITDRTIIDVIAFTNLSETIPVKVADDFERLASNLIKEYDYIFYVSPKGVTLEDNGVRTTDMDYRDRIDKNIQKVITKYKKDMKNFYKISGTTEERIKQIKSHVLL